MLFKIIDHLIHHSDQPTNRSLLKIILRFGIPFNSSHSFSIQKLSESESRLKQPLTWFNKNHLRGTHACALATLGELSAGLLLLKNFPSTRYRFILKELRCEYITQGRTELRSSVKLPSQEKDQLKSRLNTEGVVSVQLQTMIFSKKEKPVCQCTTLWQIKSWSRVKTI